MQKGLHPSQTGADHGAVLLSPGCTRFVQTVVCPLETPSTALRIGPTTTRKIINNQPVLVNLCRNIVGGQVLRDKEE